MEKPILQDSPSFVDLCTLHQHAMRYYRLWIYACNTVLALATLVFTVFAVSVLVDPRISLLSGVELYQPTFLYAYVALLLQCGVLQAIGCVGALRLNQRLLNTYWSLLVVLMIGDILVGFVWAFRLDQIKSNLRPMLKHKLATLYGKDEAFTEVWDWVQTHDMCCGVDGPIDFQRLNESMLSGLDSSEVSNDSWPSLNVLREPLLPVPHHRDRDRDRDRDPEPSSPLVKLPSTCCIFTMSPASLSSTTVEPPSSFGSSSSESVPESWRHQQQQQQQRRQHYKNWGGSSSNIRATASATSTGDRSANDPMSSRGASGTSSTHYYYQPPQHLTSNNNYNNNYPEHLNYPENFINTYMSSNGNANTSARFNSNSLEISDLRQYPMTMTEPVSSSAAYFSSGGSTVHNRRKAKAGNQLGTSGGTSRGPYGPYGSTTESPDSRRPSSTVAGICLLPPHLKQSLVPVPEEDGSSSSSTTTSQPEEQQSSTTPEPPAASSSTPVPSSSSSPSGNPHRHSHAHHSRPRFTLSMEQHGEGCGDKVRKWVEQSSDVLFVIGFCIIVFLKGCFVAILRYEIKEMIEKIKLLNGEDAGRTAAMNELIGLTSMYETGNEDSGEREGLMSGLHNNNQDTSNTNVDSLEGDLGGLHHNRDRGQDNRHGGGAGGLGGGPPSPRKDSIHYVKENHLIGNNVGRPPGARGYIGNHIGGSLPAYTNSSIGDDYPRVLAVGREPILSCQPAPAPVVQNKMEIEEDFDSGSQLLQSGRNKTPTPPPPPKVIGNSKHYLQFRQQHPNPHRNENGGRSLPKNGNNNSSDPVGGEGEVQGIPTSVSNPLPLAIDAVGGVTTASIH